MATLVGYWNLDETAGTTLADSSGNGNTLTVNGTLGNVSPPGSITFTDPNARNSSGATANFAQLSSAPSGWPNGNTPWSIAFWMNRSAATGEYLVASFQSNPSTCWYFSVWDNALVAGYGAFGSGLAQCNFGFTSGVWHHVAYTWDGVTDAFYIDGVSQTVATPGVHTTSTVSDRIQLFTNTVFGTNPSPGAFSLDDMRVYSGALTAGEVTTLAGGGGVPPIGGVWSPENTGRVRFSALRRGPHQTEVTPQLGVKTGTGLPDVQGRATPLQRRVPAALFDSLPPRIAVAAPPAVDSPMTPRRIYIPAASPSAQVMPQVGVATGTGLPDVQGGAVIPLRRLPSPPNEVMPQMAAAAPATPAVDQPRVPPRLRLFAARPIEELPPVAVATQPPPDGGPSRIRAFFRSMRPQLGDALPPLPPVVFGPPQPPPLIARFFRRVKTIAHDIWWPLVGPPTPIQTLRPPFTALVDAAAMTVVPGAQQLTVAVDAQSFTLDGDT